jgi:hypothetical protein
MNIPKITYQPIKLSIMDDYNAKKYENCSKIPEPLIVMSFDEDAQYVDEIITSVLDPDSDFVFLE